MEDYNKKLDELKKVFNWLITGLGKHGLEISDVRYIDWKWICENYNVDEFKCNHKKVEDIGSVVVAGNSNGNIFERYYDGYCTICKKPVSGTTTLDGEIIQRWE